MNQRYDGLNLAELMDLMHGIVEPAPVSWLPQTPGWWILLGWLAGSAASVFFYLRRRRRLNRYRAAAEAELDAIAARAESAPGVAAGQIAALLKRTALCAYGRDAVASLTGKDWALFLCTTTDNDPRIAESADALVQAAYRRDADGRTLLPVARRWIRTHRV